MEALDMRRSLPWVVLGLALTGCGSEPETAPSPATPVPAAPPSLSVAALEDGQTGRIPASAFFRDESGRLWVDADASVVPSRFDAPSAPKLEDTAWVGKLAGQVQLGLDLTAAEHLKPRPSPREANWIEARDLAAVVARIKDGYHHEAVR
jgi:hypothetical protein